MVKYSSPLFAPVAIQKPGICFDRLLGLVTRKALLLLQNSHTSAFEGSFSCKLSSTDPGNFELDEFCKCRLGVCQSPISVFYCSL